MLQESFLVQLPVLSGKGLLLAALLKSTGFHLWEAIRISAEQIALSLQTAEEIQVIRLDGINCNSKQPLNIQLVCEDLQNTSFPPQLPFWTLENPLSSWRPVYRIKKESDEIKHYQFPTSLQGNLLNKILEDNNQWTIPHNTEKGYQKKKSDPEVLPKFLFSVTFLTCFRCWLYVFCSAEQYKIFQHPPVLARWLLWTNTDRAFHSTAFLTCLVTWKSCLTWERSQRCGVSQLTWNLLEKPSKWKVFLRATRAPS